MALERGNELDKDTLNGIVIDKGTHVSRYKGAWGRFSPLCGLMLCDPSHDLYLLTISHLMCIKPEMYYNIPQK